MRLNVEVQVDLMLHQESLHTGGSAETGTSTVNETETINYTTAIMQPTTSGDEYEGKGLGFFKI